MTYFWCVTHLSHHPKANDPHYLYRHSPQISKLIPRCTGNIASKTQFVNLHQKCIICCDGRTVVFESRIILSHTICALSLLLFINCIFTKKSETFLSPLYIVLWVHVYKDKLGMCCMYKLQHSALVTILKLHVTCDDETKVKNLW